jgi:ABC-type xylose transport system permease subunit
MENQYFETVTKRSKSFYFAIILTFVLFLLMLNTDLAQYSQHLDTKVPTWFVQLLLVIDVAILGCLALVYFYRKIGVYLFPVLVLLHHLLYEFYLSTTLLAGLHLLFVFLTAGLLVIIPRWKSYK